MSSRWLRATIREAPGISLASISKLARYPPFGFCQCISIPARVFHDKLTVFLQLGHYVEPYNPTTVAVHHRTQMLAAVDEPALPWLDTEAKTSPTAPFLFALLHIR